MVYVYINYPNPHYTVHGDPSCTFIKKGRKINQRTMMIEAANPSEIRKQFLDKNLRFSATRQSNDLWLEISVGASEVETGIINFIREILGARYRRLSNAPITWHCQKDQG